MYKVTNTVTKRVRPYFIVSWVVSSYIYLNLVLI